MKTYYVLIDRKIWDGNPEYDQLVGLIEDNPEGVAFGGNITGVTVLTEAVFCRQFNKGKITSRRFELFTIEV